MSWTLPALLSQMQKCPFQRANKNFFRFFACLSSSWKCQRFKQYRKKEWCICVILCKLYIHTAFSFIKILWVTVHDCLHPPLHVHANLTTLKAAVCTTSIDQFDSNSARQLNHFTKIRMSCPCHIHFIVHFVRGADPFRSKTNSLTRWHYQHIGEIFSPLRKQCKPKIWQITSHKNSWISLMLWAFMFSYAVNRVFSW